MLTRVPPAVVSIVVSSASARINWIPRPRVAGSTPSGRGRRQSPRSSTTTEPIPGSVA